MPPVRSVFALGLLLLSSACARLSFTAVNLPTHFDDVTVIHDIAYGAGPEQKLDIYLPPNAGDQPRDVVVFFYGGRWETGTREQYPLRRHGLCAAGLYRRHPGLREIPCSQIPGLRAGRGQGPGLGRRQPSATYHGDATRIHVAGHSSGAHIGALLTTNAAYLQAEGKDRSRVIHDFTGLSGPYSFEPDEKDLIDIFGPPANYPQMQADTFVDGKQPPMYLLWGADDTLVGLINMDKMIGAVTVHGGCIKTKIYPGTDHIGTVAGLTWINPDKIPVLNDMVQYFNQHPAPGTCPD